jgi:hypothetical protein
MMKYTINISFIFSEKLEQSFVLWSQNNPLLYHFNWLRLIGQKDGTMTICAQIALENLQELQKMSGLVESRLHLELKKDFNEDVVFFMSALERL